jgi:hypothetical protein
MTLENETLIATKLSEPYRTTKTPWFISDLSIDSSGPDRFKNLSGFHQAKTVYFSTNGSLDLKRYFYTAPTIELFTLSRTKIIEHCASKPSVIQEWKNTHKIKLLH